MELPKHFGWWVLAVALLSVPMVLVTALVTAVQLPAMDGLTAHMPMAVRSEVAKVILDRATTAAAEQPIERMAHLNVPLSSVDSSAWSLKCSDAVKAGSADALPLCQRAVSVNPTMWTLSRLGLAQEAAGHTCDAAQSFAAADARQHGSDAIILHNWGRSALRCGHAQESIAALQEAVEIDRLAASPRYNDADAKVNLIRDREWLVVAYTANKQPREAAAACTLGHPEWKSCNCHANGSLMRCEDAR